MFIFVNVYILFLKHMLIINKTNGAENKIKYNNELPNNSKTAIIPTIMVNAICRPILFFNFCGGTHSKLPRMTIAIEPIKIIIVIIFSMSPKD